MLLKGVIAIYSENRNLSINKSAELLIDKGGGICSNRWISGRWHHYVFHSLYCYMEQIH